MIVPYATPCLCMHERMMQPVNVHIGACACVCVCITMRGGTSAPASRNCSVKCMLRVSVLVLMLVHPINAMHAGCAASQLSNGTRARRVPIERLEAPACKAAPRPDARWGRCTRSVARAARSGGGLPIVTVGANRGCGWRRGDDEGDGARPRRGGGVIAWRDDWATDRDQGAWRGGCSGEKGRHS